MGVDPSVGVHPPRSKTLLLRLPAVPIGLPRQCSRPGCAERAIVTLTYQYDRAHVWLDELTEEREPHGYDLCRRHTAGLSAPAGWRVVDRRGGVRLMAV